MQQPEEASDFEYVVSGEDPVVVTVRGEIDLHTSPQLSAVLNDLTLFNPNVVLDLGGVDYIDSTGINVLVRASAGLQKAQGHLRVPSVSERVRRVLELAGVDRLVPLPPRRPNQ